MQTEDGSLTLVHPVFGEAYSSRHGAWMQANELYLKQTQTHRHSSPHVLEIGFGLGVNFRAALDNCVQRGVPLAYLSYEFLPVSREVLTSVEVPLGPQSQPVWAALLTHWPPRPRLPLVLEGFWGRLEVRREDVTAAEFPARWASAVYLDPFSPEVNPEPWQEPVLRRLFEAVQPGGYLATYSVAGQVRRGLEAAGFSVKKVPGVGKKAWTQARRP
ncbi:MAG: tRNA (5-methylaminomethyl-2-thiouridine)(34)-methyltransferase MnmD [Meiothermus sp.]|uniref:tRNA (5-methylaminomethyl-2-thiouridine)(34)-methyltransferase MnmD n=1 Tax=Meiothermus sp. TaxID=1955249 RepID=UPI0025FB6A30|nr:tRNA (5-methylaminomethyl-2-thiouridine)(34)-methyltransferase MnmD [Meiothermus sp.]MCS7067736.1 tRNA (5-methylaminomethyl-2-thiouridine)(34)-methyltransferase MnmD [Meiothermus sp.]MDW8424511.1 tRNA (5-methylaminomethyl-2-thiouridine)(34)-methyltransferase MnmD [Meiothermus sp.]